MIARTQWSIPVALALTLLAASAWAVTGADVLKQLNRDSDQTLEIPEVIDAAVKVFSAINPDNDLTLERKETEGRLADADWKAVNKTTTRRSTPTTAARSTPRFRAAVFLCGPTSGDSVTSRDTRPSRPQGSTPRGRWRSGGRCDVCW
jgi:hypothetical protein